MKCRKCGADLLDTDTYCVQCGHRVDQPMLCPSCGEELREGERFCHQCGAPIETAAEDGEIPLHRLHTVDIPFEQIEQGILLGAKQAIGKRPKRQTEYYDVYERRDEEIKRPQRQMPPSRLRYEEDEEEYEDEDEYEEYEDGGGSGMKVITAVLGIAVMAVGLAIGFIFWQRGGMPDFGILGAGQGAQADEAGNGEGENGISADAPGRIQILSNVNVRNEPTTNGSEVMMVAKTGETYEHYGLVDNAWYHIKLEDGRDGYVSAKYAEDLGTIQK